MDSASPELARAWQLYFKQRGGVGPTLPPDVLPVVVLDNNAFGPYPCCRPWFAGVRVTPVAAQRSAVVIGNYDGQAPGGGLTTQPPVKSICVVDRIRIWSVDGALAVPVDIQIRLTTVNEEPINVLARKADDAVGDYAGLWGTGTTPQLSMVQIGGRNAANLLSSLHNVPIRTLLAVDLQGPWILHPQQQVNFVQEVNAGQIEAFAQGRYYGGA